MAGEFIYIYIYLVAGVRKHRREPKFSRQLELAGWHQSSISLGSHTEARMSPSTGARRFVLICTLYLFEQARRPEAELPRQR